MAGDGRHGLARSGDHDGSGQPWAATMAGYRAASSGGCHLFVRDNPPTSLQTISYDELVGFGP